MKPYWSLLSGKVDDLSLRERAMMFAAAGFVLIAALNALLLDPLLSKQKTLSAQMQQQQEKNKELQAEMQILIQAKQDVEHSPLRLRMAELKQQLEEQDGYMRSNRDHLVEPGKMAHLLEQVLNKNARLQLVSLKTLPVSLLIEKKAAGDVAGQSAVSETTAQKQIYKHGVQISIRGSYLELLQYMNALEKLPTQMFWAEANLTVEKYPDAVLTLVLYTLSLDKTWLTV
jgi:MSHA biogenesis protein MshJ